MGITTRLRALFGVEQPLRLPWAQRTQDTGEGSRATSPRAAAGKRLGPHGSDHIAPPPAGDIRTSHRAAARAAEGLAQALAPRTAGQRKAQPSDRPGAAERQHPAGLRRGGARKLAEAVDRLRPAVHRRPDYAANEARLGQLAAFAARSGAAELRVLDLDYYQVKNPEAVARLVAALPGLRELSLGNAVVHPDLVRGLLEQLPSNTRITRLHLPYGALDEQLLGHLARACPRLELLTSAPPTQPAQVHAITGATWQAGVAVGAPTAAPAGGAAAPPQADPWGEANLPAEIQAKILSLLGPEELHQQTLAIDPPATPRRQGLTDAWQGQFAAKGWQAPPAALASGPRALARAYNQALTLERAVAEGRPRAHDAINLEANERKLGELAALASRGGGAALARLDLTGFQPRNPAALARLVAACGNLRELEVGNAVLGPQSATALLEALPPNTTIARLGLGVVGLTPTMLAAIPRAFPRLQTLTSAPPPPGDEGGLRLAAMVKAVTGASWQSSGFRLF